MYWANFFHIYQPPHWPSAIIRKVAKESYRPLLKILKKHHQLKITLNISGSLTEQFAALKLKDIINDIRQLAKRGQIELVGTAKYHPILPILPESEIIRQIKLNQQTNQKYFGGVYRPKGFFPPEMCYGTKLPRIINKLGFCWIILDEISAAGQIGKVAFNQAYTASEIKIVFRNRKISDYISFYSDIKYSQGFWQEVKSDQRSAYALVTGMDGENLGHHRPGLEKYWEKLVTDPAVKPTTISELLKKYQKQANIHPRPASWSTYPQELKKDNPYVLWHDPENSIHYLQWQLVNDVIAIVDDQSRRPHFKNARTRLDEALASDQFWWASAKPWWSFNIIKKKTLELYHLSLLIDKNNPAIAKLVSEIINLARQWQKNGKFKKIADQYLSTNQTNGVRYIGGKKIIAS